MRKRNWLARFSFSFIIVAAVLAWEGYQTRRGTRPARPAWAAYAFVAGAALCFGLGLRGVRERHRMLEEGSPDGRQDRQGGEGGDA